MKDTNEEMKQIEMLGSSNIVASNNIPYALISAEIEGDATNILAELTQIERYYKIYNKGADFVTEGSNGCYVPATLRYKMSASLINKEVRFLFGETPDITIDAKGDSGIISESTREELTNVQSLIKEVLDKNMFEDILIKGAKDCFIGKRVACLVNFNEDDGITLSFLPSTQFIYETKSTNPNKLIKFVCFQNINNELSSKEKRIFKKKYTLENEKVYLEEGLYDGTGMLVETLTAKTSIELENIPAVVFINDGLSGETRGESEIDILSEYEKWYSKLSNADIDAERKSMNPTKFTVDMDSNSTKDLSSAAGSFWDLGSDQNLENGKPQVGLLEPQMHYSESLKTSLDRIKTTGYEQIDMPNVTLETLQGAITSGKSLKAIYWPLIVRCKEKMKMWGPKLRTVIDIIIEGALAYPNCAKEYIDIGIVPVSYEVSVTQNLPLPEDEMEEKEVDITEVEAKVMSRKTYMQKWHKLTDEEVEDELKQIAYERSIIDDASFMPSNTGLDDNDIPYPEA